MSNKMGEAIRNFRENPCEQRTKKEMEDSLWNEIIEAVKGQRKSSARLTFTLIHPEDCRDIPNCIADEVERYGVRKGFNDALAELFKDILAKIERNHDATINALSGSGTDGKRWIRATLGNVLVNKIFSEEIKAWRKDEVRVNKVIEAWKGTDDWKKIEAGKRDEAETRKREEIRKKFDPAGREISVDGIKKVPIEVAREGKEGPYLENRQDTQQVAEFWEKHYEDLKDEGSSVDVIKWQHEAFFWRPDEEFRGKKLTGGNSGRGMYIAFFYSWLRRCSYATFAEIAEEADVTLSTASRNWKPHPDLEEPFPDSADDKEGMGRLYEIFHPVYFHKNARSSIGMYDPQISRYSGDYNESGDKYPPILRRKEILWDIYDLLRDFQKINRLKINYDRIDNVFGDFSLEIVSNKEVGICPKKRTPSFFVHIKTIEVGNAQNTDRKHR